MDDSRKGDRTSRGPVPLCREELEPGGEAERGSTRLETERWEVVYRRRRIDYQKKQSKTEQGKRERAGSRRRKPGRMTRSSPALAALFETCRSDP
ncbi:hypothetical protein Micbo1qcDRAFT_44280 [Microdochium bolleyi]|uniref:Uncharacterized protein n=1 Tax=Microdochium bolleyi TaxID=196109 RepID=A0A136JBN9_9PEZI|nr:hypothetical protein Micbo1qcDRAFT_44280 [Microdochium bolleyi]